MSIIILNVDEVRRTLSASGGAFVAHDKEVDIVRFAINSGFADIVLDGQVALRVMYQRPGEAEVRAKTLTYYDTDGLHNYYDWQLSQSDLAKNGSLTVALCILRIDSEVEEWHTTPYQIRVLGSIHTDDSDEGDESITPTVAQRVAVLETMIQRVASGAPIVVDSASDMTDADRIYVLTTDSKWYYYDGTEWAEGGTYGAVGTDTTLTQSGVPADAKAVGTIVERVGTRANVKSALYTLLASAVYTVQDVSAALNTVKTWAGVTTDTTAMIASENKVLRHGASYYEEDMPFGGVTIKYAMQEPTNVLYPAGIIPTTGDVIASGGASLVVYDASGTPVNYVNERTGSSGYNRWARDATGTMTEYSNSWTLSAEYSSIAFSVDMRYLDDAYMYDKTTGMVFFAGINTPYYGMTNISQADEEG